jgi:hypothetical protein
MSNNEACVLYTSARHADALSLEIRLKALGLDVCLAEIAAEVAQRVKSGDRSSLPAGVAECLEGASLCFVLVDETGDSMGALAGIASDMGCRVISIGGSPEDLPDSLDDIVDAHLPDIGNDRLPDAVSGEAIRVRPDNSLAPARKENRVKCQ